MPKIRIFLTVTWLFVGVVTLVVHADTPVSTVQVEVQGSPVTHSADVTVQTRMPGRVQAKPVKQTWTTRVVRLVEQIISGTIFF